MHRRTDHGEDQRKRRCRGGTLRDAGIAAGRRGFDQQRSRSRHGPRTVRMAVSGAWEKIMALLIVDLDKRIGNATAWRDTFAEQLPDLEIRIWPDPGELADIQYLAFMRPDCDTLPVCPNLKAMFSRSAGVE